MTLCPTEVKQRYNQRKMQKKKRIRNSGNVWHYFSKKKTQQILLRNSGFELNPVFWNIHKGAVMTAMMCKHSHFLRQNTDCIPRDGAHDLQRDSEVMGHRVHSVQPSEFSHLSLLVGRHWEFPDSCVFFPSVFSPHKHTGKETAHYLHMKVRKKTQQKPNTF